MLISIRERSAAMDGSNATLSFDNEGEYPITISDPFSEQEEKLLEWYFEEHLRFPFLRKVDAATAATSITHYGEALFKQVFRDGDPDAYARYKEGVQAGVSELRFEITGSPRFHRLHWEALKDPKLPEALALHAPMVRKNLNTQPVRATLRSSPTINLLIVTARPGGERDVGYRTISRPLVENLRQAHLRVQVEILRPGTYEALFNHLQDVKSRHGAGYYHIVHFDVHGALLTHDDFQQAGQSDRFLYQSRYGRSDIEQYEGSKAFLFLEGVKDNQPDPVEAGELADLLIIHQVPIAILNACQSGKQVGASETSLGSRLMQAGVQMVLAMGYSVTVSAAESMMQTLYRQLFAGHDLPTVICRTRLELHNRKGRRAYFNQMIDLEDWLLPVAYQNRELRLKLREFTPEEETVYYQRKATNYAPAQPPYGFVGRDLDILQIEKRLLMKRNILLVRGMGGAGKTTLLHHLGAWWQTTHFVEQVYYFGYDEKAWTRQQIMHGIAQQLLSPVELARFQPLSLNAQQKFLAERLRAHRHLLILDNLESITGTHLAILNTLSPDEQQALRGLLADLAGGHTLVLLGSRSGEEWLAKETFADNVYDLPGLDPEAASTLADKILERHHASHYRQDENLLRLLKLLDGYPLPLEVVLANLSRQTPKAVLEALQAGDVTLDSGNDHQQKTESILRCIDYSHSNLSPEAQGLLTCLAPFSAVVNQASIKNYTDKLRQQPALAHLPFERWEEVLQEAKQWGLLTPDPNVPGFLRLQPIFPYFLRGRLHTPEQAEVKRAVETVFHDYYEKMSGEITGLQQSKSVFEKLLGKELARLEYENIFTALNLALNEQASIVKPYTVLSNYLDATQDHHRGLELGKTVLGQLEEYSPAKLAGPLGYDLIGTIASIAQRQLSLKRYPEAEELYKKALEILLQNRSIDADLERHISASICHQLGVVAQEQRQWEQAEQYYRQALQIKIDFDDHYSQAFTYLELGSVAAAQQQWEQARDYFLLALKIFIAFEDLRNRGIAIRCLARLRHETSDESIVSAMTRIMEISVAEVDKLLSSANRESGY